MNKVQNLFAAWVKETHVWGGNQTWSNEKFLVGLSGDWSNLAC